MSTHILIEEFGEAGPLVNDDELTRQLSDLCREVARESEALRTEMELGEEFEKQLAVWRALYA